MNLGGQVKVVNYLLAQMDALKTYGSSSDEESNEPQSSPKIIFSSSLVPTVNTIAPVEIKEDVLKMVPVDPHSRELVHNPRYDQLFAPKVYFI